MVRLLAHCLGFIVLLFLAVVLYQSPEVDTTTEATAAESTASLSLTCVDPTILAFAPNLTYTVTIPAPTSETAFSAGSITASATIANAVNGGGDPSVTVGTDLGPPAITMYHTASYTKLGGVQCSTSSQAKLEAYGDGTDNTYFDVAVGSNSTTAWPASYRIDQLDSGSKATVFGSSGWLGSNVSDGSDADSLTNGEIAFGGSGAASSGGHRLFGKVTYLGAVLSNVTETITFVFTAQ